MDNQIGRRQLIAGLGAAGAMGVLSKFFESDALAASSAENKPFNILELPPLPYPEDALEPVIDKETVKIHHGKHFAAYVAGLNKDIKNLEQVRQSGSYESIKPITSNLAFNISGVILHWIYFSTIGPSAGSKPGPKLESLIKRDFGSFETFWKQFSSASKSVEASGWGVLAWEPFSEKLLILQAEKHQNLTSWGCMPIMVCDVWEHAYYLKYQNRRAEYVENFAKIIDWAQVEGRLEKFCLKK